MFNITAYTTSEHPCNLEQLSMKRDWMEQTAERHAYRCFPVSLTNTAGWGISFPEDITFIWDGINNADPNHIKILSGEKYAYPDRGNATVSFHTGITFKTDETVSILQTPAPNQFIDGIYGFSSIISTSFYSGELPCVVKVTKPNVPITIKANTQIFSIIPIDLNSLNNSEITFEHPSKMPALPYKGEDYVKRQREIILSGSWTDFYRNAVDHLGNSVGKHSLKTIRLKVNKENE